MRAIGPIAQKFGRLATVRVGDVGGGNAFNTHSPREYRGENFARKKKIGITKPRDASSWQR